MRRLNILLIVSIALNLLLVGLIAGALLSWRARGIPVGRVLLAQESLRGVVRDATPEERAKLEAVLKRAHVSSEAARTEGRHARRELRELVTAPTFDEAGVRSTFARMRAADAQVVETYQEATIEVLRDAPQDRREALLKSLMRRRFGAAQRPPPRPEPAPGIDARPAEPAERP